MLRCSTSFPCMMSRARYLFCLTCLGILVSVTPASAQESNEVNRLLDEWHRAAAIADEDVFFGFIADDGIYIGTDVHERWTKTEFEEFAMPYFKRGTAWDFKPYERDLHFNPAGDIAWFSELLSTWMGECRGSGILQKTEKGWRLKQYHLSVTVPNDIIQSFIKLVNEYHAKQQK